MGEEREGAGTGGKTGPSWVCMSRWRHEGGGRVVTPVGCGGRGAVAGGGGKTQCLLKEAPLMPDIGGVVQAQEDNMGTLIHLLSR